MARIPVSTTAHDDAAWDSWRTACCCAAYDTTCPCGAWARPVTVQPDAPATTAAELATALTEKAVINFLNDLVAFYLVKVHWELISQRWLKDPVKHANAWLTVFYLMFLLVRYRKSIATPVVTAKPGEPATP